MSFQAVRGAYEQAVIAALAPIPVFVGNQAVEDLDAASEYGMVRVSFGETTELNVGCEPSENLQGALVCEVYTRKGEGPGRGLELITPVVVALNQMNKSPAQTGQQVITRVTQISGPSQVALDDVPHYMTRLSCGVRARYDGS